MHLRILVCDSMYVTVTMISHGQCSLAFNIYQVITPDSGGPAH